MTSPIKAGIVGYGYAAKTFHAPLIAAVAGLHLAAVSSSDPVKVGSDWPGLPVFASPQALFACDEIELVVIPTPNDTHFPLAAQALAAGKHVVVDKPFTLTAHEAQELIAMARRHDRLLSVFHNRRWDSDFLTLQSVLREGALGRVTHLESHFDRYRPEVRARWRESAGAGTGLWFDLGPHLLDQALELFGMPQAIGLDLARQRDGAAVDDWFHALLRYGEMRVVLHGSALVPAVGPRFTVHGTRGSFVKWGLDPQEDALKAGLKPGTAHWGADPSPGCLTLRNGDAVSEQIVPSVPGDYLAYYAAIRDAIRLGTPNPVPADQALQVMRLIDCGIASAREGRTLRLDA
jgi:scyllo-inositol 2-dehydrogenase (NADP+)